MRTDDALALAADWAKVCDAAGVDTDATANEVIEGFVIDHAALSAALYEVYDHGTQPNAHREAREIIRLLAERDAALEAAARAAQGAAPQAAKDIHEPNHDRVYCVRCGGNWPCQPAPVLPSSGVDEDALAEVIASAVRFSVMDYDDAEAVPVARAVAAWLKGQGR